MSETDDSDNVLNVSIKLELDGMILDTTLDITEMLLEAIEYLQDQGASEVDCLAALAMTLEAMLEGSEAHSIH
jgi:phosphoribosylpyrophosphate synthetase